MKELTVKNHLISKAAPTICVPVMGESFDEVVKGVKSAVKAGAAMVEWRADYFENLQDSLELGRLLWKLKEITPDTVLVFTIRTVREGGTGDLSQKKIEEILMEVAESGCVDFVDYEFSQGTDVKKMISSLQELGAKVIASHHEFERTPSKDEMMKLLKDMEASGADIVKLAIMPKDFKDTLRLMDTSLEFDEESDCPLISMAMGDLGKVSRVAGRFFGSVVTFAALGAESAPGQISYGEIRVL